MREQLLGYLLEALEEDERNEIEDELQRNPKLQRELELLHESLEPLRAGDVQYQPPPDLVERTCRFVYEQATFLRRPAVVVGGEAALSDRRWSLADMAVAAGIFIAATMLLFPAMQHSREGARLAGCQNNLRQLGLALAEYSSRNHGYFPAIDAGGKTSVAGVYAVRLKQGGLLSGPEQLVCPASSLAENTTDVRVPTHEELQAAEGETLSRLHRMMGGSYGYNLGYMQNDIYKNVKNLQRPTFAIMADAPGMGREDRRSDNHAGCGQNVLYEDGHVRYMKQCAARGLSDHIYLNDEGLMAAGIHSNDAVVGHSASRPLLRAVSFGK